MLLGVYLVYDSFIWGLEWIFSLEVCVLLVSNVLRHLPLKSFN